MISPEKWWNFCSVIVLLCATRWRQCNSTHFYGEELAANLASNGTDLIITINWRLTWNTLRQPNNEQLFTCVSGLGKPCSSGPSFILMEPQTAICKSIVTSIDGFQYMPWTGLDSQVYFPLNAIPENYSTIGMTFQDNDWGLITAFWVPMLTNYYGDFGGQLIVMTSRRTDNGGFNGTPRSPVAAIIILFPGCGGYNFTIPTYDPDGDIVWCRWSMATAECNRCCRSGYGAPYPFTLSNDCVLTYTGGLVGSNVYYAVCIQMEDYYVSDIADYEAALIANNGTNETATPPQRLSSASLQFVVEISPNISPCQAVSPIINDKCSLQLIRCTCTQSISSVVANTIAPVSYDNSINSTVDLNCSDGYYTNPTNLSVTCVQISATKAHWVPNGQCSRMYIREYCSYFLYKYAFV